VQYRRDTDRLLYGAPAVTFDVLQRVQNILARVVTQEFQTQQRYAIA